MRISWKLLKHQASCLMVVSLLAAASTILAPVAAQKVEPTTPPQIDALAARYAQFDFVDLMLRDVGFPPPPLSTEEWRGWTDWPIERKLAQALVMADSTRKGAADELMRYFAHRLAEHVDAVRDDKRLMELFPSVSIAPREKPLPELAKPTISWPKNAVSLSTSAASQELPARLLVLVNSFAEHAYRLGGGLHGVAIYCCPKANTQIEKILFSADTPKDALIRIINSAENDSEKSMYLTRMTESIISRSASFLYTPQLGIFKELIKGMVDKDANVATAARNSFQMRFELNLLRQQVGQF